MKKLNLLLLVLTCTFGQSQQLLFDQPLKLLETYTGYYNYTVTGGSLRQFADIEFADSQCYLKEQDTAPLQDIPDNAIIKKAYLYWAGSGAFWNPSLSKYEGDKSVILNVEGIDYSPEVKRGYRTGYKSELPNSVYHFSYTADITDIITTHRNNNYTLKDLNPITTEPYCQYRSVLAGWAIIVIYKDINQEYQKKVNLYEGLALNRYSLSDFTLSGLNTPPNPKGKITTVIWEGDEKINATENGFYERLLFKGHDISDNINPFGNIFNSTRNYPDPSTEEYGIDVDTYDVSKYLSEGDKSVTLTVGSAKDLILTNAIVMEADTYTPLIDVKKTSNFEQKGERIKIGDEITYSIDISNKKEAKEPAYSISVIDQLPDGLEYIGPTIRNYFINDNFQDNKTPATRFSDNSGNSNLNLFEFDAARQYHTQWLTFDNPTQHEEAETNFIHLDISGNSANCENIFLIFAGPNGTIKTYNLGDIKCEDGVFKINETFKASEIASIAGNPFGSYSLNWYDEINDDYYNNDNYNIDSKMSISYKFKGIKSRKPVQDSKNDDEFIFDPEENIEIMPGENIRITLKAKVTDLNPFEKVNTVYFTADNVTDPVTATATDKMVICTKPSINGSPRKTQVGISTLNRNTEEWLTNDNNKLGAYLVLESTKKGLAITQHADPTEVQNPVEGMLIWDSKDQCLKLYQSNGTGSAWSNCLQQSCNE